MMCLFRSPAAASNHRRFLIELPTVPSSQGYRTAREGLVRVLNYTVAIIMRSTCLVELLWQLQQLDAPKASSPSLLLGAQCGPAYCVFVLHML